MISMNIKIVLYIRNDRFTYKVRALPKGGT